MDRRVHRFKRLSGMFIGLFFFFYPVDPMIATSLFEAVNKVQVNKIKSFDKMKSFLERLDRSSKKAIDEKSLTFNHQKLILNKAGQCHQQLVLIYEQKKQGNGAFRSEVKALFLLNREIIRQILILNENSVRQYHEHRLDGMKDPLAFFNSREWQNLQHLVSLASYWLAWNGYHCSLLIPTDDPMRKTLLDEAIKGFSRAFVEFREEAMIAQILFGRGLCYFESKAYESARNDFKSVRAMVDRGDILSLRCRYQEALISFETNNPELALRGIERLEEILENYSMDKFPLTLKSAVNDLRSKVLVGLLEKQIREDPNQIKNLDEQSLGLLNELKRLAMNRSGAAELYHFAKKYAERLEYLSYAELGPISACAIADRFFEEGNDRKALRYYQQIYRDSPFLLKESMDKIHFRISYIHYTREKWDSAISMLKDFSAKFPESSFEEQAVSLYYTVASENYREKASKNAYSVFIQAIQCYLDRCKTCPHDSEAQFHLARFYQKEGKREEAVQSYRRIKKDSPRYMLAKYHLLQLYIEELDGLNRDLQLQSERADELYKDAVKVLKEYQHLRSRHKVTSQIKRIDLHMFILHAKLLALGPDQACRKGLQKLSDFENRFPGEKMLLPEVTGFRVTCYHRLQMAGKAEEEIYRLIRTFPVDSKGYTAWQSMANKFYTESRALYDTDRKDAAGRFAETALIVYQELLNYSLKSPEQSSYTGAIQLRMARLYSDEQEYSKAIEVYENILRNDPLSADAMYHLGLLYDKTGQWKEALQTWRRFSSGIASGTQRWFEARYRTAMALQNLGEINKACEIVIMTLVLHPDLSSDEMKKAYLNLKARICKGES